MDPCVTCGTTEETTPVCTCDCQCINTVNQAGNREIRLIAPTRDTDTAWTENDPIVPEGVLCLVKDRLFDGSLEYFIGDGESKYSELTMLYAGAPLSRTGAENHSPLAASGKSTLDPSWLPDATNSAKGAVMTSTTGATGKVPIADSGVNALDPSWLPAATSSALGGVKTSTTGAEGTVPITASGATTLDPSWLPDATSSTKGAVKASTTKAANNVVKADSNGGLDGWKDAIIDAITDDNGSGGLIADPDTGDLMVDFSQMPTDKFEALLKGLKMKIPMDASTKKNYYVNKSHTNASDNTEDITVGNVTYKRGDESYPFKTIQACVNYITETYAIGAYNVVIYISGDTYTESVTLPNYDRTTGTITLQATNSATPPTIQIAEGTGTVISIVGGQWKLQRLNITGTFTLVQDTTANYCTVLGADRSANVSLYGCHLSGEYTGAVPVRYYRVVGIGAGNNATVTIYPFEGYQTELNLVVGNATVGEVLQASNYGQILTGTGNNAFSNNEYVIACSGSCTTFAKATSTGRIARRTGGLYNMYFSGTVTGAQYGAETGGSLIAPVGGFPGDTSGTVDSSTYCWYTEASS